MSKDGTSVPECINNSQCREITIDGQVPIEWALPLYGYAMPIIVAVTLATNSFIVVVLSRRHLRTPTNVVMLAMAVSELLTGLTCLPWLLYYYTFSGYETDRLMGLPAFWCTMFPYMASILPSIFHTSAVWLTVYLAVQRYIYICQPKVVRKQCTVQRSKQVIAVICIISIWIYAPELFATYNQSFQMYSPRTNRTRTVCLRVRTVFIEFLGNDLYYYTIYAFHTVFSHTLPCILLVGFTWKLIAEIRLADRRHAYLVANKTQAIRRYTNDAICPLAMNGHNRSAGSNRRAVTVTKSGSGATLSASPPPPPLPPQSPPPLPDGSFTESLVYSSGGGNNNSSGMAIKRCASTSESKRVQGLKQNTRMLIAVILLFLLTEIPAALIFSLHVSAVAFRITIIQQHYTVLNKLLIVRNVLIVVTYPFRFAIYCGMSQQFRDVVRQMLTTRRHFFGGSAAGNFQRKETTASLFNNINSSGTVTKINGGVELLPNNDRQPLLVSLGDTSGRRRSTSSAYRSGCYSTQTATTNGHSSAGGVIMAENGDLNEMAFTPGGGDSEEEIGNSSITVAAQALPRNGDGASLNESVLCVRMDGNNSCLGKL